MRCLKLKSAPDLRRRPFNLFQRSLKSFFNIFHKKMLSVQDKKWSVLFQSRHRVKVDLTRGNAKFTSNTGSKGYVRLTNNSKNPSICVRKTEVFGWSSVSDAFCNRLSFIEHTNLRGNTQNFRHEFQSSKTRRKSNQLNTYFSQSVSWLLSIGQLHDKDEED